MQIELACLGIFRELGDHVRVDVEGTTVHDLRVALKSHLLTHNEAGLAAVVERSVFAAGDTLLHDGDPIPEQTLAILPPVAGG